MPELRVGRRTVKDSTDLARRSLSSGYFQGRDQLWKPCPVCRTQVVSPSLMGRFSLKDLRAQLIDHLRYDDDCNPKGTP